MGRELEEKVTTEVETARQTLADLEQKLAAAEARVVEMSTERRRIAYAATTGDADAKRALDKLNKESAVAGLDIENVRSALDEAKRRLAEAERAESMAAATENAEAALVIADRLVERAAKIDAALATAREELHAYKHDLQGLHLAGCAARQEINFSHSAA
jgi:predicted  nucleic acid-binding Zn-ribbon protein